MTAVASDLEIPGRLERVDGDPPVFLDAAHNPQGAAALAEALAGVAAGRPVVACLAVLADKDAKGMIEAFAPALDRAICTAPTPADGPKSQVGLDFSARRRAFGAGGLARMCAEVGLPAEVEADFAAAVRRGRELAAGAGGVLVVTGSHYALAPARAALGLCED